MSHLLSQIVYIRTYSTIKICKADGAVLFAGKRKNSNFAESDS